MENIKKTAIITGGRRGIGLGAARRFASEGYNVVICATAAVSDSAELLLENDNFDYIQCDISNTADRDNLLREVIKKYGRIECLINCAGVAPLARTDLLLMSEESFDRVIDINLKGTFFLTQKVAELMINEKKADKDFIPRIINIGSISSYTSSTTRGEYCISKAGVSMVTALFADYLAAYGIPVFEVRPGIIQTDMTAGIHEKYEKLIDEGLTPIKRFGQPEDVADCIWACASGLLDFATGQVINADGGFHLRRL